MEALFNEILKSLVSGLLMGAVFALVALGLTVIFGVMDIVNFAHGEFLMAGMYTTFLASTAWGLDPLVTLPLAALSGAVLGLAAYYGLVRFLLRGPALAQLFGTFGLMVFLRNVALIIMGSEPRIVPEGLLVGSSYLVGPGVVLDATKVVSAVASVASFALVWWLMHRTRVGKALTATSLDKEGARYMGISTERMNALAWIIGGGSASMAGGLLVNFWPVSPNVGLLFTMIAFATVALGGFGSVRGAFVAGLLIGLIVNLPPVWDAILRATGGQLWSIHSFKYTMVYLIYFLIMVVRPQGLFGWKQ
ncbi:MAG: branched-chain amino acid ABC transporter permease [Deltaproteobacteria bacterium]|nr:branched-chain amino acid ABC transporter permease [Deltaproteobacteria bacterium]